ncbi:cupin domain-containing protein [Cesiribacter andamanensis]|uniref:Cupin type-2 domain-containing protein n=1 Tax=Cesiribacter andamanensis AMV16 TaxID=1279009 RepID=M7NU34_9BACT|nr:cupin domain-containing protein [Cesiribacter andamanensis]EMR02004.1 putative protein containing double-stranded beta helix domain protein [Cesiribacter andamanensis AMV16]
MASVSPHHLAPKSRIPNNPRYPLLLYKGIAAAANDPLQFFRDRFSEHEWAGSWTNGIYSYHHYHSTSHEVLGVYSGSARLVFGGPGGEEIDVKAGDGVVIPAGVGHCCTWASEDFGVIGAYPQGQEDYDVCTKKDDPEEKKKAIAKVPMPPADPFEGKAGHLLTAWKQEKPFA